MSCIIVIVCYCKSDLTSSHRLWQSAGYSESDPALHSVLVRLLTDPPDGYQPLFDPTATALGKWLEHQSGEGVALRDELVEAYKGKAKVQYKFFIVCMLYVSLFNQIYERLRPHQLMSLVALYQLSTKIRGKEEWAWLKAMLSFQSICQPRRQWS